MYLLLYLYYLLLPTHNWSNWIYLFKYFCKSTIGQLYDIAFLVQNIFVSSSPPLTLDWALLGEMTSQNVGAVEGKPSTSTFHLQLVSFHWNVWESLDVPMKNINKRSGLPISSVAGRCGRRLSVVLTWTRPVKPTVHLLITRVPLRFMIIIMKSQPHANQRFKHPELHLSSI